MAMGALLITAAVTILAAFGAAWYGASLQRRSTPNPIPAIEAVGGRIGELRRRMEEIEQERIESENFTLGMKLQQGQVGSYLLDVRNDADKDVTVETVEIFRGDASISAPYKAKPTDDWCIAAGSIKTLSWAPWRDPVNTLQYSEPNLQGFAVPFRIVLVCQSVGKRRTARQTLLLSVDFRRNTLTQFGP
jgi:hypothetical protein